MKRRLSNTGAGEKTEALYQIFKIARIVWRIFKLGRDSSGPCPRVGGGTGMTTINPKHIPTSERRNEETSGSVYMTGGINTDRHI